MKIKLEEDVSVSLKKIDLMLSNPREILNSVAINAQKSTEEAFNSEQDPDTSSPWNDLTSPTWKKKKSNKKLQETFAGKNSIKFYIQGSKIFIKFETYMIYHISGTYKMRKRNFIVTPKDDQVKVIAEDSIKGFIERLPKKSFT
jgi:phage gpG-like protein